MRGPLAPLARHPLVLAALALLLVNDHVLKHAFPGFWTGKLSDVSGLTFAPVLLCVVLGGRTTRHVAWAAGVVAVGFASIKLSPVACEAYATALGQLQWAVRLPFWLLRDVPVPSAAPAVVTLDPTDVCALPFVGVGVGLSRRRHGAADGGGAEAAPTDPRTPASACR